MSFENAWLNVLALQMIIFGQDLPQFHLGTLTQLIVLKASEPPYAGMVQTAKARWQIILQH